MGGLSREVELGQGGGKGGQTKNLCFYNKGLLMGLLFASSKLSGVEFWTDVLDFI